VQPEGTVEEPDVLAPYLIAFAERSLRTHKGHLDGITVESQMKFRKRTPMMMEAFLDNPAGLAEFLKGREGEPAARSLRRMVETP